MLNISQQPDKVDGMSRFIMHPDKFFVKNESIVARPFLFFPILDF